MRCDLHCVRGIELITTNIQTIEDTMSLWEMRARFNLEPLTSSRAYEIMRMS